MTTDTDENFRYTRYPDVPNALLEPSNSDLSLIGRCISDSHDHASGGSYDMVAWVANSKPIAAGYNQLDSPASLKSEMYPEMCGMHAELALWSNYKEYLSGGTVAIAGVINKSQNKMSNTMPCLYCATIMYQAGVRWVVFMIDAQPVKTSIDLLIPVKKET